LTHDWRLAKVTRHAADPGIGKSLPNSFTITELPSTLAYEPQGAVGILRLARAARRNALDLHTITGLERFFSTPPQGVKAIVLAGEGDHFCAGLDLAEMTEKSVAEGMAHSRAWHRAFAAIEFGTVPVVCALHGAVIGGLELAAATHVRVAESTAYYALPEGTRGIFVGGGGSVRLPRLIGVSRMMEMMLTGRSYNAEEGQAIGLTHYLTAPGAGLAKALDLAARIAQNAPMTNHAVMHVLPRIAAAAPEAGYAMEAMISAIAQAEPEAKARLRDFVEKRGPKVMPNG
jgi:(methylthio)acryloyl-CoA hydratase